MSDLVTEYAVSTENLSYLFPNKKVGLANITLAVPKHSRVLIVGPNGAGKSTLLKILAGQKLIKSGKILINGVDPFAFNKPAPASANSTGAPRQMGITTYLGTEWANNEITKRDVPVTVLIGSIGGDLLPERRDLLIDLLDIDISWRMNQISDGERRRVQLAMGLLKPWNLLLLDEVTVDLDVLVRNRLLSFLAKETETRDATVIYATHIFDGLGGNFGDKYKSWPTSIVHLSGGKKLQDFSIDQIEYVNESESNDEKIIKIAKVNSLHPLALKWLNQDLIARGERSEDKTRPKWTDLEKEMESKYYDDKGRVTDYFKTTRSVN
ncbi:hypothetical protein PACTADRAFT_42173 [Pachysolen tannophilus NRRL Y-2460]|uniref:ABC transporter domain-containing protein n=1 Tax=Pachysolen tannophilus NRRL Y-2460 TaxID=669874 RepID=A0A1E4TUG7_PACTA|nr:hypothetical protein PACTADRAFT_42173 [Pachysolen tannophilus NRRL Y-2460]